MKKFWVFLISALMVAVSVFSVVGCNTSENEKVLTNYTLAEDGKLIEDDFTLPLAVNGHEVTWASSDGTAIALEKGSEEWLAKVTLQDEAKPVTLTVSCGDESKQFNMSVRALDVSYFVEKFKFSNDKATVYEDFTLPTEFEKFGKKATITWDVGDYGNYLEINEDGNKCLVTPSSIDRATRIYATFKYNNKTQRTNYRMTVSFERKHQEAIDYWNYNTGVSVKMSGYILAIATAYASSYNNVSLYMVDDDFCAGYYLYRVKLADKADASKLVPGAHVTVTNATSTVYNGLVESNQDGLLTVEGNSLTQEQLLSHVYALDNDLLAFSPAAIYHTGSLVSLTDWAVKADGTADSVVLTKGGVDVTVTTSKYFEGAYKTGDATCTAITDKFKTLKKDDVVSVTGILSNYNGFQILPFSADKIVKSESAASAAPAATAVKAAIDAVQANFKANGVSSYAYANNLFNAVNGYTVIKGSTITPATVGDGVTVTYELLHATNTVAATAYTAEDNKDVYGLIDNGSIVVTVGEEDIARIRVTYTCGDYTTYTYHTLHTRQMSDKQVVTNIEFNLELPQTSIAVGTVELPTKYAQFPEATISWSLVTTDVTGVSVKDGKTLEVEANTVADRDIVLRATITHGTESTEKDFDFKALKVTPIEEGTYKFAFTNATKTVYATGEMSGNYGAATENEIDAPDVVLAKVEGGYTLQIGDKYIGIVHSGKYYNFALSDEPIVLEYDYTNKAFVKDFDGTYYFLGGNGTYTTFGAYNISTIADGSHWIAQLKTPTKFTDAEYVDAALAGVTDSLKINEAGDVTLPKSKGNGVVFTYTLPAGTTVATVSEGKLSVAQLPAADTTVELTLAAKCGDVTKTKTITVTIKKVVDLSKGAEFDFSDLANGSEITDVTKAKTLLNTACGGEVITSVDTITKVYQGDGSNGGCIKFGTGSADGTLTVTFSKNVKKVTINCVGWTANDKVAVNTLEAQSLNAKDGDRKDCVFTLDTATNSITIKATQRIIIYSFSVEFEAEAA